MSGADRCVVCGTIVPEGRMVCYNCEKMEGSMTEDNIMHGLLHYNLTGDYERGRAARVPKIDEANREKCLTCEAEECNGKCKRIKTKRSDKIHGKSSSGSDVYI